VAVTVRCHRITVGLFVIVTLFCSCTTKRSESATPKPSTRVLSTTPPFKTKEPDRYQAVRSITFVDSNGGAPIVTTASIARYGDLRRSEENGGRLVYLDLAGRSFIVFPQEKIYAETTGTPSTNQPEDAALDGSDDNYVHTAPIESTYENLGAESINGQNCTKYRVVVKNGSDSTVSEAETLIWIDERLGMPIKSMTRSAGGTRTMELSAVRLSADEQLFEIPKEYKKIEAKALRERMR